jgi:hypothetical protein
MPLYVIAVICWDNSIEAEEARMNSRVRSGLVAVALMFPPSIAFASCLEEAAGFAERVCGEISSRGSSQLISGSGGFNAEAKGLIARMLGTAQGDAKVDAALSSYENVAREELTKEHANVRDCRIRMVEVAVKQVCPETPVKKDRSTTIQPIQQFYAAGSAIYQNINVPNVTDTQIDALTGEANKWYNDTIQWLKNNMTEGAVARFTNNSDKLSFSFNLDGKHAPEEKKKRDDTLNGLAGCLTNLETIMKTDLWDPR